MTPTTDHLHHSTAATGAVWDERYAVHEWGREPDDELVELVTPLTPGEALDLGCGTGRHALWLADAGWRVTGVDGSPVGLDQLRAAAGARGRSVTTVVADLAVYEPERDAYDLVVIANVHLAPRDREALFAAAARALRPGGHLYVVGHHLEALGRSGPPDPDLLYTEAVLEAGFAGLDVERLERLERRTEDGEDRPIVDVLLWATRRGVPA